MKNRIFLTMMVAVFALCCTNSVFAGSGKGGGKLSVDVCNGNEFDDENGDIRVWLLTEAEAAEPPTTKAEADALPSVNVASAAFATFFDLDEGNYVLVASNENHYQSLEDDDSFEPGVDWSVAIFDVLEVNAFTVTNGEGETRLPVISEGCDF